MGKAHGMNTKAVAERLKHQLDLDPERFRCIDLYYDHGDSSKPEVCQPTTYMGRRYGADATLSGVDIVAAKGKDIVLAVEIEEGAVRPKIILGDVFGIALAQRLRIHGKPYRVNKATIVIGIAAPGKGKQPEKYARLERHLNAYFRENPSPSIKKVRIVSCPINDLVRRIERLIRFEVGKVTKD